MTTPQSWQEMTQSEKNRFQLQDIYVLTLPPASPDTVDPTASVYCTPPYQGCVGVHQLAIDDWTKIAACLDVRGDPPPL